MTIQQAPRIAVVIAFLFGGEIAQAQEFPFPSAAVRDSASLASYQPRLATEVIAVYRESDRPAYLGSLFRL